MIIGIWEIVKWIIVIGVTVISWLAYPTPTQILSNILPALIPIILILCLGTNIFVLLFLAGAKLLFSTLFKKEEKKETKK